MPVEMICIAGPTAAGKTAVSVQLAKSLGSEIINADSRQIYKWMDIGTAKPEKKDQEAVVHHMLDIINPDSRFNAGQYSEAAGRIADGIIKKGKIPVVCGGTGLYIKALLYGLADSPTLQPDIRNSLIEEEKEKAEYYLYEKLKKVDPEAASKIHPNDKPKIIRGLEVYIATGKPITYYQNMHRFEKMKYNALIIGIRRRKEELYKIIEERVHRMVETGLIREVESLLKMGYDETAPAMNSLGYRHFISCLRGKINLNDAVELTIKDTKKYAKRQFTWFNKVEGIEWIDIGLDERCVTDKVENLVYERRKQGV